MTTLDPLAVVPVLAGPLTVLWPILSGLLVGLLTAAVALLKPSALKNTFKLLWRQKIPVVCVLAVLAGGVYGVRALLAALRPPPKIAEDCGQDWPLARGDIARRGRVPGAPDPTRGGLNWQWKSSDQKFLSCPAVVGNRVYVSTVTLGPFEKGSICCLDADSGALVWEAVPKGYRPTFSSPVVSGKYLVCGEGLHVTPDARVVCLDLTQEGKTVWMMRTKNHVECTPVISDGKVYVGAGDDGFYCIALEPDANGQAQVLWHVPGTLARADASAKGPFYDDAETGLTVYKGRVYAGLGIGDWSSAEQGFTGRKLCVLDAHTGAELKRLPMPFPVFSPPAISGGKIFLGMGNGDYVNAAEKVREEEMARYRKEIKNEAELKTISDMLAPGGAVCCVDLESLQVEWTCKLPATVIGPLAATEEHVYCGSFDGYVYCLDRKGRIAAKWPSHAPIVTGPVVTDQHVYVVNEAGMLYALDRESLDPVWEFRLGGAADAMFFSSPVVARGKVYVGTSSDGFLCLGEPGEKRETPHWPGHLGGPGRAGTRDGSPIAPTGEYNWQYPPGLEGQTQLGYVQAPAAGVGGDLLVPLAAGPALGLACLPIGGALKEAPKPRWLQATKNGVFLSPALLEDSVFVVDGRPGDASRQLQALDLATGKQRWQAEVASPASGVFTVTESEVLIQDQPDALASFDLHGLCHWRVSVGGLERAAGTTETLVLVASVKPPALLALDRPTGKDLWRVALPAAPLASPVPAKDTVYLATPAGLEARSLVDGQPVADWKLDGGPASGDFWVGREHLAYVNAKGEVVFLQRADGEVLWRRAGAQPGFAPLVSRDAVLYVGPAALLRLPLDNKGQPVQWLDISWLGKMTAPPVLKDSYLYMGMAGWGLVRAGQGR